MTENDVKQEILKQIEVRLREMTPVVGTFSELWGTGIEGNSVGIIGERFFGEFIKKGKGKLISSVLFGTSIHDFYDAEIENLKNNKKITIELKTAKIGSTKNSREEKETFQFDNIHPAYNVDYIVCIGISFNEVMFYVVNKNRDLFKTESDDCMFKIYSSKGNEKELKLVAMSPHDKVSKKLTLNIKDMYSSSDFIRFAANKGWIE